MGSVAATAGFLVAGLFEYNFGDSEVVMVAYSVMALAFAALQPEPAARLLLMELVTAVSSEASFPSTPSWPHPSG
jgi:hypothetical protein